MMHVYVGFSFYQNSVCRSNDGCYGYVRGAGPHFEGLPGLYTCELMTGPVIIKKEINTILQNKVVAVPTWVAVLPCKFPRCKRGDGKSGASTPVIGGARPPWGEDDMRGDRGSGARTPVTMFSNNNCLHICHINLLGTL